MKISWKPVSGGDYTVLFDETDGAGAFVPGLTPATESLSYSAQMFGQARRRRGAMGNLQTSFALVFRESYETPGDALASLATYAAKLDTSYHVKVEEGAAAVYFPNALCTGHQLAELTGVAATHSLSFQSDAPTATAP